MIDIKRDYAYFKKENKNFIDKLKEIDSLIYLRFEGIIEVLDSLEKQETFTNDELSIFDIGYLYLFDQLEMVNTYLSNNFSSIEELDDKSVLITFLLDLDDLCCQLANDNEERSKLEKYILKVEDILLSEQILSDELYQKIDDFIKKISQKHNLNTIVDLFNSNT